MIGLFSLPIKNDDVMLEIKTRKTGLEWSNQS